MVWNRMGESQKGGRHSEKLWILSTCSRDTWANPSDHLALVWNKVPTTLCAKATERPIKSRAGILAIAKGTEGTVRNLIPTEVIIFRKHLGLPRNSVCGLAVERTRFSESYRNRSAQVLTVWNHTPMRSTGSSLLMELQLEQNSDVLRNQSFFFVWFGFAFPWKVSGKIVQKQIQIKIFY